MKTLLLHAGDPRDIAQAGAILRGGGLVAIPTETVYGLAANALDGQAVAKIFAAKGRPADNPLIVHISAFSQLAPLVGSIPEAARKLAQAFWPGPLTLILKKAPIIPMETSGGLDTVAIRLPAHPAARAVIDAAGVPLAAPSANLSGRPSPTAFAHVQADLTGRVDALLNGGDCPVGVESTVVSLAGEVPVVLRPGGVTLRQLRAVLGRVDLDPAVLRQLEEGVKAASPGMKYRHYSPRAQVALVDASPEAYAAFVNQRAGGFALCFDEDLPALSVPSISLGSRYDGAEQARRLFRALHQLDERDVKTAYAHCPRKAGVGLAVYNRLIRAAGFTVLRPGGPVVVGLTGPSGAGKSTVAGLLEKSGCASIDCDALTRSPQVYDAACLAELQKAFGHAVAPMGVLDRGELARRAFSTQDGRKALGDITFPRILAALRKRVEELTAEGWKIILLDAPTLFEAGLDQACTRILVVTAPREERLRRVTARDGIGRKEALARFSAQQEEDFYVDRADYVIENGPGMRLEGQARWVLEELASIREAKGGAEGQRL